MCMLSLAGSAFVMGLRIEERRGKKVTFLSLKQMMKVSRARDMSRVQENTAEGHFRPDSCPIRRAGSEIRPVVTDSWG